jgi:protease IV
MAKKKRSIWNIFGIISAVAGALVSIFILFMVLAVAIAVFAPADSVITGNVAVIPVQGVITTTGGGFGASSAVSGDIVKLIKKADESNVVDVIVIEVNSPGGSPVASYEIAQAIKNTKKPTVAVIREVGASGGYWVASAADTVFANALSITGSIGVIGSYLEIPDLLENYNVTYRRLVKGKYKDAGSPFKTLTGEEEALFDHILQDLYEAFIAEVAANRDMTFSDVEELATGFVYLGVEAKELGLVDVLGTREDAIAFIEETYEVKASVVILQKNPGFLDVFSGVINENAFSLGKGIADGFKVSEEPLFRT